MGAVDNKHKWMVLSVPPRGERALEPASSWSPAALATVASSIAGVQLTSRAAHCLGLSGACLCGPLQGGPPPPSFQNGGEAFGGRPPMMPPPGFGMGPPPPQQQGAPPPMGGAPPMSAPPPLAPPPGMPASMLSAATPAPQQQAPPPGLDLSGEIWVETKNAQGKVGRLVKRAFRPTLLGIHLFRFRYRLVWLCATCVTKCHEKCTGDEQKVVSTIVLVLSTLCSSSMRF